MTFEERQVLRSLVDQASRARVERELRREIEDGLLELCCENCGQEFPVSPRPGPVKRYCSPECRKRASDRRYSRRAWRTNERFRELKRVRKRRYDARRKGQAETAAALAGSEATVSNTEEGTWTPIAA